MLGKDLRFIKRFIWKIKKVSWVTRKGDREGSEAIIVANQDHFWGNTHFRAITGRDKVELLKDCSGGSNSACGVCGKVGCRHPEEVFE